MVLFDASAAQPAKAPPPAPPASAVPAAPASAVPAPPAPPASVAPPGVTPAEPRVTPEEPRVYSVGQVADGITRALRALGGGAPVWVQGEVADLRTSARGHMYFGLKDEHRDARIDVTIFASSLSPRARRALSPGALVKVRGRPSFYAPRGKVQLDADRVELAGRGALLEALEKLKEKLTAEGLFAPERKRPLPASPRVVGVVTSRSGAVIHDICKVAFRRGGASILLSPATVQGPEAAPAMVRAIAELCRVPDVDVIIVARGGGSQDDLHAFNDEALVRAVAAAPVPIVSAVGHETDTTLIDFAADARAATPSQAAELVVPDRLGRRNRLRELESSLRRAVTARLASAQAELSLATSGLPEVRESLHRAQQRADELAEALERFPRNLDARKLALADLAGRLRGAHPRERVGRDARGVESLLSRLVGAMRPRLEAGRATLSRHDVALRAAGPVALRRGTDAHRELTARLDAMSPLKVLSRGYSIVSAESGAVVRDARELSRGARVSIRFAAGRAAAEVTDVTPEEEQAE